MTKAVTRSHPSAWSSAQSLFILSTASNIFPKHCFVYPGPIYLYLSLSINIARGTTDPEIDCVTWTKFSYTPHGRICISCIFGHQTAPLAIVEEEKIGHNMTPFAFVANLAHMH